MPTNVASGWAPYHDGHWAWIAPWGWTWVDDAPWGFAPYHYGSWVTIGNRWSWVPGPRHGRPIGRPTGSPVVGRPPSGPRDHGWHVPRPPRSYTVQSGVPASEVPRIGMRPGVVSNDDLSRRDSWRERRSGSLDNNGSRNNDGRIRTLPDPIPSTMRPDDSRVRTPRYDVPRNPRMDSRVGTYTPPAAAPSAEEPRRNGSRFGTGSSSPQPQPRPALPPPQQQPRPVQAQPAPSPRPAAPAANVDRSGGGPRPKATQER